MDPIFIGVILYLIIVLFIGFKTVGKNKTHSDYMLAGRKLGSWAISLSERASAESAWLLLGLPGIVYASGVGEIWVVLGCVIGILFTWKFLARPIRDLAGKYDSLTIPDLISSYFGDKVIVRLVASLIITFFFIFYVAAQFSGAGKTINTTFGLPKHVGMIIGASIIVLYTILGGFNAVVWTDVVQAIIMITALVLLPILGLVEIIKASPEALHSLPTQHLSLTGGEAGFAGILAVVSGLSWAFGYTGQPHLIARYMAIDDSEHIKKGRKIAYMWAIPAFTGAFFIGIVAFNLFGPDIVADSEQIMPYVANNLLPAWFAGILISGAMAAMMSTADSQLIVAASSVAEDLYHKIGDKKTSPKKMLVVSRVVTVLVGILAFALAWTSEDLIFTLVSYAWSGLGASFGPVLLCIIYWKKITKEGAIAGMLTGSITTVVWKNIPPLQEIVAERFVSYILAFLAIFLVSYFTEKED